MAQEAGNKKVQATDMEQFFLKIAQNFEIWKEETDSSVLHHFVRVLINTPAKDLQNGSTPHRISSKLSIIEALESIDTSKTLMIESESRDLLASRVTFLQHALHSSQLSEPVHNIMSEINELETIYGNETLDVVIQKLFHSGQQEIGILDGGGLSFVLHLDDVYNFLSKEISKAGALCTNEKNTRRQSIFKAPDEQVGLSVNSKDEVKKRVSQRASMSMLSPFQLSAQQFCKLFWTEVLMVACILLDVTCAIVDYAGRDPGTNEKLEVATGIILFVFMYEASVRVFGFRWGLLRLPFDLIDLTIVTVSVIVYSMVLKDMLTTDSKSVVTITRIIRGLRMFKVVKLMVETVMRRRKMYNQDGFALDLSFVTRSCIAMSRPAVGSDANFANPVEEVRRFLDTKFPDRYLLFDLSTKPTYTDDYFHGRVERIRVEKHNPPRLSQMVAFVEQVGKLMDEDPKACIAVHCKSGRDRTGVMVAAWLLYSRFSETADDAMRWFADRRVGKRATVAQALPMPSQQRYVRYMEEAVRHGGFHAPRLLLARVQLVPPPRAAGGRPLSLGLIVDQDGREVCSWLDGRLRAEVSDHAASFEVQVAVAGDVRLTVLQRDGEAGGRDELCCFVCFHTGFVAPQLQAFPKAEVDVAASDAAARIFPKDFTLLLDFAPALPSLQAGGGHAARAAARGRFRRLVRPSKRVVDEAVRLRGRDLRMQKDSAAQRATKVLFHSLSAAPHAAAEEGAAAGGPEASLCCARGPVVSHEAVNLFRSVAGGPGEATGGRAGARRFRPAAYLAQSAGARLVRSLVSGNKRRFQEDGFDLDLTYITARLIAMGFPSSGLESSYRNSKDDVYRFFQERHAGRYLIVNLCSERAYSLDLFHGNCVRYPFPDHNPPALELLLPCCARIHKFLQADPDNVVAVHCKAGKGRTGLVVVCYLLYAGLQPTAARARAMYDERRTSDAKGVTITSQIRYAHYFEQLLRRRARAPDQPLATAQDQAPAVALHRLRVFSPPQAHAADGPAELGVTVEVKSEADHQAYQLFPPPLPENPAAPRGREGLAMAAALNFSGRHRPSAPALSDGLRDATPPPGTPGPPSPAAGAGGSRGGGERQSGRSLEGLDWVDLPLVGPDGAGTRVAGDVRVTAREEGRAKEAFFLWVHSGLLQEPPEDMGGTARGLDPEECRRERLPEGSWSLTLAKHEVDRAAKDTRCAHFDPDFRLQLFFTPLPGQTGSGPALDAARTTAALASQSTPHGDASPGPKHADGGAAERPLHADREAHRRFVAAASKAGRPPPSFEDWLLGADMDLAATLPLEASYRKNTTPPASTPANWNSAAAHDADVSSGNMATATLEINGAPVP